MWVFLLHVCLTPNVGALWRDEVNTINLATQPTWHDVWRFHNQDSFPLLFAATVRIWSTFFSASDESIRLLGLLIGLGGVGAFWINARMMRLRFPFWSLVLVAGNPMIIRYGDSGRAYGLSMVFLLLMFGLIWRLTSTQNWKWFGVACLAAVAGVHTVYYNAVLLFALCLAGSFVTVRHHNWRGAWSVFAVGAVAAVSLLPYAPTFLHANDWNFLVQYPFTLSLMWERLSEVTGSPFYIGVWIWSFVVVTAAVVAGFAIVHSAANTDKNEPAAVVTYCGVALVVGIVAYTGFLKLLSYHTNPWYYVSLITFVGACVDPILQPNGATLHRLVRAGAGAIFLIAAAVPTWKIVAARHTNLDVVAHELEQLASPRDLVILTHWQCAVTFNRYYHGPAQWMTVPPLHDFRFQAHQPILAHMREEAPLAPLFARSREVLRGGHRIWVVGGAPPPPPGKYPPTLPRVTGADSWRGSADFYSVWAMQVMYFLRQHVTHVQTVTGPDIGPVGPYENFPLSAGVGWR
jgi:hypothetical protein